MTIICVLLFLPCVLTCLSTKKEDGGLRLILQEVTTRESSIKIDWMLPAVYNANNVRQYNVFLSGEGKSSLASVEALGHIHHYSFIFTSLKPSTKYVVTVKANLVNTTLSMKSNQADVLTLPAGSETQQMIRELKTGQSSIRIEWTLPSHYNVTNIRAYNVFISGGGTTSFELVEKREKPFNYIHAFTSLKPSTKYAVGVKVLVIDTTNPIGQNKVNVVTLPTAMP